MRSLALIACLAAPLAVGHAAAQTDGGSPRTDDRRCRDAGFRSGTPAYQRCRATLERNRALPPGRRPAQRGSVYTQPPGLVPHPLPSPPVVRTPPPVIVAPSLPPPPAIIGGPDLERGYPVAPGPRPVVPTPPPIILGPRN
jgi:hypothetical protein